MKKPSTQFPLLSNEWKYLPPPWWLRQIRICLQRRRPGFDPWVRKISWRWEWLPTPVFLPGEFQWQRSLVGYSPWGRKESDTTEQIAHTPVLLFSDENNTHHPYIARALNKGTPKLKVYSIFSRLWCPSFTRLEWGKICFWIQYSFMKKNRDPTVGLEKRRIQCW